MKQHTPLEQARELLLENTKPAEDRDALPLPQALGRVAAEDVRARIDLPPFDKSPLDGYAFWHGDAAGATAETPATLRVTQMIVAGDAPRLPLRRGEAARIMTGAPLPEGADCVVRQESAEADGDSVRVFAQPRENENVCFCGEDVKTGQLLIPSGQRLDSVAIGVLAGQGLAKAAVYRRPVLGVLSTGSELLDIGEELRPGKIFDSNLYLLAARAEELGCEVRRALAPDEPETLARALGNMLAECDLVVSTGGVSVGLHDYMPAVGGMLGAEKLFHGVAMRPGSPVLALMVRGKPAICLSGNPFAAFAAFELLAVPCLLKCAGEANPLPRRVKGILQSDFPKSSPMRRIIRAKVEAGAVSLPEGHTSGMLASLSGCNCLLDIPAGSGALSAGEGVEAFLLRKV